MLGGGGAVETRFVILRFRRDNMWWAGETTWRVIGLLAALGQMALGVGMIAYYGGHPEGTLAGIVFFVPGALTFVAMRFRWLAILALSANALLVGLSAMWMPGFLICFLLDTQHRGVFAIELAKQMLYTSTGVLSILALRTPK
jgi:hypothetical protein